MTYHEHDVQPWGAGPCSSYRQRARSRDRVTPTKEGQMNIMVQPPDYYLLMTMRTPSSRPRHDPPARPKGPSLRSRFHAMVTRTTMGPRIGDHILGDSQWVTRTATR
jgi:hypothetical protein